MEIGVYTLNFLKTENQHLNDYQIGLYTTLQNILLKKGKEKDCAMLVFKRARKLNMFNQNLNCTYYDCLRACRLYFQAMVRDTYHRYFFVLSMKKLRE